MDDQQSTQEGPDTRANNITLPSALWQWINQKHTDLMRSWPSTRKAAIIRAALMMAIEANPDVHGCTSDEEVIERFQQATRLPERTPRMPES